MSKRNQWMVAITAMTVVGLGLASVGWGHLMRGRPTAVAVVNVEKLFEQLSERTQIEADQQVHADRLREQEQERRRKISDLQSDMDLLTPGTDAHNRKREELEMATLEMQAWVQFEQRKINRERGLRIENLYRKMLAAVAEVAEANGYDLVLFHEGDPEFRYDNPQQLTTMIQLRKVLYHAQDLDITGLLATKMNNDWTSRRR